MKSESEEQRLARAIGAQVRKGTITISLVQARLLADELAVLEALVDRRVLTKDYDLVTEHGPEPLLNPGQEGL